MAIELPTIEAIKRFVAMGNGVALVPHLTVARELESGRPGAGSGGRAGDEAGAAAGASAAGHAVLCRQGVFAHGAGAGQGAGTAVLLPCGAAGMMLSRACAGSRALILNSGFVPAQDAYFRRAASIALRDFDRSQATAFRHGPPRPFTMLRAGPGSNRRTGIDKSRCQPDGCAVVRFRTE